MEYNIGNSTNPIFLFLEVTNGNLIVKDASGVVVWQTEGNPTCWESPRGFNDLNEGYQYFLTHSLSNKLTDEEIEARNGNS
jgi:hypothetical protein